MENKDFLNNLRCPECHNKLKASEKALACMSCKKEYKTIHNIPDFREKDEYWCNVSRKKMQELNKLARETDWFSAAKKVLPTYSNHFTPFYRADCQFLWPTDKDSKILDIGSMWGGITIPAAQYNGEVYAVDKTEETLDFLNIRAEQMGFKNIHSVVCGARKMPFPNNFFDLVVLSGVLEWVALDEDVVLEKQWQKTGRGNKIGSTKKYPENPTQMQLKVLSEAMRVLKPGGSLYLAIENRMGYLYFLGFPDDHMNLPFLCLMPRFLANFVTKIFLKSDYRTFIYSVFGYNKLLNKAGFKKIEFYGVFNHYINPREVAPIEILPVLKKKIFDQKRWQLKLISKFIPSEILKYLSPSIICFASKDKKPNFDPKIKQLFQKAGLIDDNCYNFRAVKWDGRFENDLPVNFLVYVNSGKKPDYFCKICRDKQFENVLAIEAENLKIAQSYLGKTKLAENIPALVYFGQIDGISFLVTKYLDGKPIAGPNNFPILNKLATKLWLNKIDTKMRMAILFLNDLQKLSCSEKNKVLQHGDYDICNILVLKDKINVIDFEHAEDKKSPFFDLGNLIFSPLILQWKTSKTKKKLKDFADDYGWTERIKKWVEYYSQISGISMDVLKFLPKLAVIEQNEKKYPSHRDPYTYPMYGDDIIKEMQEWTL